MSATETVELSPDGRVWAESNDLDMMATVVLEPDLWPDGFVRLARRYANDVGAGIEAGRLFRELKKTIGSVETLALLRRLHDVVNERRQGG